MTGIYFGEKMIPKDSSWVEVYISLPQYFRTQKHRAEGTDFEKKCTETWQQKKGEVEHAEDEQKEKNGMVIFLKW